MTKEKLSKIIKDVNKENTPPGGWKKASGSGPGPGNTIVEKKEDKIMTNEEAAASVDLEVSDFSDDGADLEDLKDILDGRE